METNKQTKWGVYFEMDTNEFMWDNGTQQIGNHVPPLLFDTKEEEKNVQRDGIQGLLLSILRTY